MPKKSSKKIKMSQKQKQTTKQSVVVNVRNVINERRRRPAPKPKPKEIRDTVTLQPRSSFLGNNLMMGNVSRYVQPAMAFAVNPPQLPMQQTAVVDKPLGKPIEPKQRPDVFNGEETDPYDIRQAKKVPDLPVSEPFGVQRALYESLPMATASASSSSASGFGLYAPRPPPPAFIPEEQMGPAQAFGGPPVNVQQAILPEEKFEAEEAVPQAGAPPEPEAGQVSGRQAVKEWMRQSSSAKYGIRPTNATMRDWLEVNVYGGKGNFPEDISTYSKWKTLGTDGYEKLLYENRDKINQGAMRDSSGAPWPV
jgi:hypothetical protein